MDVGWSLPIVEGLSASDEHIAGEFLVFVLARDVQGVFCTKCGGLPARRLFVSVLGALALPCFVSGLLVLPLCGAAL